MASQPSWLNAELAEEWPDATHTGATLLVPNFGGLAVEDVASVASSSERGTMLVRTAAGTASSVFVKPQAQALAAVASAARDVFTPLKLETMFQPLLASPPPQAMPTRGEGAVPNAQFTFRCEALPAESGQTSTTPPAPAPSSGLFQLQLADTTRETLEHLDTSFSQHADVEAGGDGMSSFSEGEEEEALHAGHPGRGVETPPARSSKRVRLSMSNEEVDFAPPPSAVRERIRARRSMVSPRRTPARHDDGEASEPAAFVESRMAEANDIFARLRASGALSHEPVEQTPGGLAVVEEADEEQFSSADPSPARSIASPTKLPEHRSLAKSFADAAASSIRETLAQSDRAAARGRITLSPTMPRQAAVDSPAQSTHAPHDHAYQSYISIRPADISPSRFPPSLPSYPDAHADISFFSEPSGPVDTQQTGVSPVPATPLSARPSAQATTESRDGGGPVRSALKRQGPTTSDSRELRSVSFTEGLASIPIARRAGSALRYEVADDSTDGDVRRGSTGDSTPAAPQPSQQQMLASSYGSTDSSVFSSRKASRATTRPPNGTFLTECSFAVSYDILLRALTDQYGYEPDWHALAFVDLADRNLESLVRLKEFLPALMEARLCRNQLAYLTGVPTTMRALSLSSNRLTGLTSFQHLLRLERLDLCRNQLDSLQQLQCLTQLRELKADANQVDSLDGILRLDALEHLSLRGNRLVDLDLSEAPWLRLIHLDLADNALETIKGLETLQALVKLNLDGNELTMLLFGAACPQLRILRASGNRLDDFDVSTLPNLRTLFLDDTAVQRLAGIARLRKLENLSLRHEQAHDGLPLAPESLRDVRRLYLSGRPLLHNIFHGQRFFGLVYLELALCRLTSLPLDLATSLPNVRTMNLDSNPLVDISPLRGLARLRRLDLSGCALASCSAVLHTTAEMPELERLDVRANPCTQGFYLPPPLSTRRRAADHERYGLVERDAGEERDAQEWRDADKPFQKGMADQLYVRRLLWRALHGRGSAALRMLDGLPLHSSDRLAYDALLARMNVDAVKSDQTSARPSLTDAAPTAEPSAPPIALPASALNPPCRSLSPYAVAPQPAIALHLSQQGFSPAAEPQNASSVRLDTRQRSMDALTQDAPTSATGDWPRSYSEGRPTSLPPLPGLSRPSDVRRSILPMAPFHWPPMQHFPIDHRSASMPYPPSYLPSPPRMLSAPLHSSLPPFASHYAGNPSAHYGVSHVGPEEQQQPTHIALGGQADMRHATQRLPHQPHRVHSEPTRRLPSLSSRPRPTSTAQQLSVVEVQHPRHTASHLLTPQVGNARRPASEQSAAELHPVSPPRRQLSPPRPSFDAVLRRTMRRELAEPDSPIATRANTHSSSDAPVAIASSSRQPIQEITNLIATPAEMAQHRHIRAALAASFAERVERTTQVTGTLCEQYRARDDRWREHCEVMERGARSRCAMGETKTGPAETRRMNTVIRTAPPLSAGLGSARSSSRRNTAMSDAVRSEAEFQAILASLENADMRDPAMRATRTAAQIPDIIEVDDAERVLATLDEDCTFVADPATFYRTQACVNSREWTHDEVRTYCRRFAQHPKAFGRIAAGLPGRSTAACVTFYYANKHRIDFKSLLDKRARRRNRSLKQGGSSLMANLRPEKGDEVDDGADGDDEPSMAMLVDIPLRRMPAISRQPSSKRPGRPSPLPAIEQDISMPMLSRSDATIPPSDSGSRPPTLGYFERSSAYALSQSVDSSSSALAARHGMSLSSLLHATDQDLATSTNWFSDTEMTDEETPVARTSW